MSAPVSETLRQAPEGGRPSTGRWLLGAAIALVALVGLVIGLVVVSGVSRPVPAFPSLTEQPDPSLHGTVAYFADQGRCVRVVDAAGRPARDVLCLGEMDVATAVKEGKEIGPQLVWRSDGRLEVTMFRMPLQPGPGLNAGWQKLVDVRTGAVEDVPAADVPSSADLTTQPTLSPSGQRVSWTSDEQTGRVTVVLTDGTGTRTLLSARGPSNYTYRLSTAFWAPDWQWVAADDGRILVITTGEHPVTRVLVEAPGDGGGEFPRFAVTAADLLPSSS